MPICAQTKKRPSTCKNSPWQTRGWEGVESKCSTLTSIRGNAKLRICKCDEVRFLRHQVLNADIIVCDPRCCRCRRCRRRRSRRRCRCRRRPQTNPRILSNSQKTIYLQVHPSSIHPSLQPPPSIHQSVHYFNRHSITPSIPPSLLYPSCQHFISRFIHQCMHPSIHPSIQPSDHPADSPSVQPSLGSSIHHAFHPCAPRHFPFA